MNEARNKLDSLKEEFTKYNFDYYVPRFFSKGITDHYKTPSELQSAISAMESLEIKLAKRNGGLNLRDFNFGYKRSETLYNIEGMNIPNNVFPIFWWPLDSNNKKRKTIFRRL